MTGQDFDRQPDHWRLSGHFRRDGVAKRSFASEAEARTAGVQQQARNGSARRPYAAYLCTFGERDHWHIGRRPAKNSASGKRARRRVRRS